MNQDTEYLRIGTYYYKKVQKPLASGDVVTTLLAWSADCIKLDHGRQYLKEQVACFDGFCFVPSHLSYQARIKNFYNRYHPFQHIPQTGNYDAITAFLNHVFAEQLELAYDYFKILLELPTQILPILCLVSQERNTGKTTFLHFV